jgi:hypothetical protein
MSQDANQGYGDNTPPSQQPPDGLPPAQNPYGPPPTGYGTTPQNPYGAPQNPYEVSQNPYGVPQNPYGGPPGYNIPPPGTEPAFSGPAGNQFRLRPLPLNEAIKQLPGQYQHVLTKPGAATFAEELPKASWDITLVQILIMIVVGVVLGVIHAAITPAIANTALSGSGLSGVNVQTYTSLLYASSFGSAFLGIISVPLSFFIGVGIQFLIAKAFKGEGTFLTQSYTSLLYQVPLYIIVSLLSLLSVIPIAGVIIAGLVSFASFVFGVILNVFQLMAVHRLSGGKAVWVVLIPYIVAFVLLLLCGLVAGALIFSVVKNMH